MAGKKHKNTFTVLGKSFPADGVLAVVPRDNGVEVRWAKRSPLVIEGVTSSEIWFKINEAKSSTDSD